ncbi:MAG: AraC family transcriptional regulator [Xanthomonadales bacterium]|nr:AraC family transcriptional regulator [Xanthomonadales bacterium]
MSEFFGKLDRVGQMAGLRLFRTECEAHSRIGWHQHQRPFLSVLFHGSYEEGHGRSWQTCRPDALTWHPAGDAHEVIHGPETVVSLQIEFMEEHFDGLELRNMPEKRVSHACPGHGLVTARLFAKQAEHDEWSEWEVRGLVLQLLARLARKSQALACPSDAELVHSVTEALDQSFPALPDLNALADSFGQCPTQLSLQFRRATGQSVAAAARRLRVQYACRLLREGGAALADIAVACGFYDQSHMTRCFRATVHCTPGQYRSLVRAT